MAKSLKQLRKQYADNGVFYTPTELAKKMKSYIDFEPLAVYDPTCGGGGLLSVFGDDVSKFGQDIDGDAVASITLPNFVGAVGDVLTDDAFANKKFECIMANPPFSEKWQPDNAKDDPRFAPLPTLPPKSKADYAFIAHVLYHLSDNGVAVVMNSVGILYRGQREGAIRKWMIEQNFIDTIEHVDGGKFDDTAIATCIIVLRKNRTNSDVTFIHNNRKEVVSREAIAANDYTLSVSTYIDETPIKPTIDLEDTNRAAFNAFANNVKGSVEFAILIDELGTLGDALLEEYKAVLDANSKKIEDYMSVKTA